MSGFVPPADGVWDLPALTAAERAQHPVKWLFFWGHTAKADTPVGPWLFSQWYDVDFEVDGIAYRSAEHFMMAEKARLFGDEDSLAKILAARTPGEAKKLGRGVAGFDPAVWDTNCVDIVTRGSVAKFSSTPVLRDYLVGTGNRVLVEASPVDRIWGIGLAADNSAATSPSQWRGKNLLGLALMKARAELGS